MGIFEQAQAITNEHFPFNVVISLHLTNGPSGETLGNVLQILQRRHPLLGVHIHKDKGRYFFESAGTPQIPLNMVNRQNSAHWQQVVEEELNHAIDFIKGPLLRLAYLGHDHGKGESELIITSHHAIMDAESGASLLHEIMSLCQKLDSGQSLEDLKNLEPLPPAEKFFPPAFKGIRRWGHNLLFMLSQVGDEFSYRLRTRGTRKAPIHGAGRCKILTMKLPEEIGDALSRRSRKQKVTLNSLFNAAVLMAVQKHIYEGKAMPMRNFNSADLRLYLMPPLDDQYLGSYFSLMRFTVLIGKNPQVWELSRQINDIIYRALKKGWKYTSNLLSASMMRTIFKFGTFRMGTTGMSFIGAVKLGSHYGKAEIRELHAFVSNFVLGPEYTVHVRFFDKHFYWDVVYLDSDMDLDHARVITGEIRAILEAAAKEEK